ncbi:MAG: hypothetical protein HZC10_10770 [Nitrospirae bacterium]|nr:hypothetical protein [Nitrospirota bacterium]
MDKLAFIQAKNFIFSDIQREIQLAYTSDLSEGKEIMRKFGINQGGGNFLSALGLLCYTEFMGGIKRGVFRFDESKNNFNSFFKDLGKEYENFLKKHNVYKIFRCGLAHEYFVKKSCTIAMMKNGESVGIGQNKSGQYYFVVEKYFEDFKKACNKLQTQIYE